MHLDGCKCLRMRKAHLESRIQTVMRIPCNILLYDILTNNHLEIFSGKNVVDLRNAFLKYAPNKFNLVEVQARSTLFQSCRIVFPDA